MSQQGGDKETKVIFVNQASNAIGICALIFSVISIFFFALIFMPIGLVLAVIALVKKQYVLGICAIVACLIAIRYSPSLWLLFAWIGLM